MYKLKTYLILTVDVESGRMFHVSVKPPNDPEENNSDIYVTVKGHEIVEKDDVYIKVRLSCLLIIVFLAVP